MRFFAASWPLLATSCAPQVLSTFLWALATLGVPPPDDWRNLWLKVAEERLPRFTPLDLSNSLWALARLGGPVPPALLSSIQTITLVNAETTGLREQCVYLWALVKLGYPPSGSWLAQFISTSQDRMPTCSPKSMVMSLTAMAHIQYRPAEKWPKVLLEEAGEKLQQFWARDLVNLMSALATLQYRPSKQFMKEFLDECWGQREALKGFEVVLLLWALAKLNISPGWRWLDAMFKELRRHMRAGRLEGRHYAALLWAMGRLEMMSQAPVLLTRVLPSLEPLLPSCTIRELSHIIWGLGRLRLQPSPYWWHQFMSITRNKLQTGRLTAWRPRQPRAAAGSQPAQLVGPCRGDLSSQTSMVGAAALGSQHTPGLDVIATFPYLSRSTVGGVRDEPHLELGQSSVPAGLPVGSSHASHDEGKVIGPPANSLSPYHMRKLRRPGRPQMSSSPTPSSPDLPEVDAEVRVQSLVSDIFASATRNSTNELQGVDGPGPGGSDGGHVMDHKVYDTYSAVPAGHHGSKGHRPNLDYTCIDLSTLLHSMGRLRYRAPLPWLAPFLEKVMNQVDLFTPRELVNVLWALGEMYPAGMREFKTTPPIGRHPLRITKRVRKLQMAHQSGQRTTILGWRCEEGLQGTAAPRVDKRAAGGSSVSAEASRRFSRGPPESTTPSEHDPEAGSIELPLEISPPTSSTAGAAMGGALAGADNLKGTYADVPQLLASFLECYWPTSLRQLPLYTPQELTNSIMAIIKLGVSRCRARPVEAKGHIALRAQNMSPTRADETGNEMVGRPGGDTPGIPGGGPGLLRPVVPKQWLAVFTSAAVSCLSKCKAGDLSRLLWAFVNLHVALPPDSMEDLLSWLCHRQDQLTHVELYHVQYCMKVLHNRGQVSDSILDKLEEDVKRFKWRRRHFRSRLQYKRMSSNR